MSLRALLWALKEAPVTDAVSHVILMTLADYAGDDGRNVRPSQTTIANTARVSVRTVGYKLKALEAQGLIKRGDQRQVAHLQSGRRPTVWDLNLHKKIPEPAPEPDPELDPDPADTPADLEPEVEGSNLEPEVEGYSELDDGFRPAAFADHDEFRPAAFADHSSEHDLQHLQTCSTVQVTSAKGCRSDLQTVADRTVLEPSLNHVVVNSPGEAQAKPFDVTETHLHDPDAWRPSSRAMAEARDVARLIDLNLHIARYRIVKKETGKPPSNGEWLRWVIEDEKKARETEAKERLASRQSRPWYSVAD